MSEKKTIYEQITLQRAVTMCLGDEMDNLFVQEGTNLTIAVSLVQCFKQWVHEDFYERKEVTIDEK